MINIDTLARIFSITIFLVVGCNVVAGQTATPLLDVRGRIVDANGAIVVNAKVTLRQQNKSISFTSPTDDNGEFSLQVPEDDYVLSVTAVGFARESQKLSVRQASEKPLEISLAIGNLGAVVTVTSSGEYGTERIASATKTDTAVRDIPQSISIVPRQQILDQAMTSIGDVARYIPGVSAPQGENNRDQLIIRGQSSSADFYSNGVRDDGQYYRDLYNLERVETLKGPNALAFGRGGGGGVLNRVMKEAEFGPIAEVTAQGGMYGNKRFTGDFGRALGSRFAFRANGLFEDTDSFRRFVGLQRFGVTPTVTFAPDAETKLTLGYEYFRDRRTADRGITSFRGLPADVPISTYYGNPDDSHVRANVNIFRGSIERQLGRFSNLKNRTQYGDYDRFYQNYVPGASNSTGTLVALSAYNTAIRRKNFFNQTDLTVAAGTGPLRHVILGGVEFGNQRTRNFRKTGFFNNSATSILVPFDNPLTTTSVTFRQSSTDADNRLRLNLAAAYIQDQVEITKYVRLIAGARFDYFDLRFHNNRNNDNLRRIDRLISPRLGVVIKPVEQLSLYGSYSVSYLPSSGDQFASLTSVTQQVKPEQFRNVELGAKWDIRHNISLTTAVYRLDRTNTRSTDPNDPTRIIQTGSQRTNGFEAAINGSLTRKWSMTGGYAYQDAFIASATASAAAGKKVAQVPHHSFTLWNKYQLSGKLGAGLGIVSRSDAFAAIDNSVVLRGYTRVDGAVYYNFNEIWRLQGNIENLFNTRYHLNADSNTNITPGSPISARVGLIARF